MNTTPLGQYKRRIQNLADLIELIDTQRGLALAELSDAQQVCPHTVTQIKASIDVAFFGKVVGEYSECLHCGQTNFVTRELEA